MFCSVCGGVNTARTEENVRGQCFCSCSPWWRPGVRLIFRLFVQNFKLSSSERLPGSLVGERPILSKQLHSSGLSLMGISVILRRSSPSNSLRRSSVTLRTPGASTLLRWCLRFVNYMLILTFWNIAYSTALHMRWIHSPVQ